MNNKKNEENWWIMKYDVVATAWISNCCYVGRKVLPGIGIWMYETIIQWKWASEMRIGLV